MAPMTRTITLVLLGGAALAACCCLLRPPSPPPPPPERFDEDGNPIPAEAGGSGTTTATHHRPSPFWVPLFWGGSSGRAYSPPYRPGVGSPSRSAKPSPGGSVTRGGFGGTGKAVTSGAAS